MRPSLPTLVALMLPMAVGCKDSAPTSAEESATASDVVPSMHRGSDHQGPTNRGRSHTVGVRGLLSDGGTFVGVIRFREFVEENNQLIAVGEISGRARRADGRLGRVDQPFRTAVSRLTTTAASGVSTYESWQLVPAQGCSLLFIELAGINVSVLGGTLGLTVSPIAVDLTLGGLLGTLLCGLLGGIGLPLTT